MSKFRQYSTQALNIKIKDAQEEIKPVYDFYKNNLNKVWDSNINDTIASQNSCLIKQIILVS